MPEDIASKLPPKISGSKPKAKPEGWWSLPGHDFDGTRAGVLKAITEKTDMPQCWKDAIVAEINGLPEKFNHVTVDAHRCSGLTPDGKQHSTVYDIQVVGYIGL